MKALVYRIVNGKTWMLDNGKSGVIFRIDYIAIDHDAKMTEDKDYGFASDSFKNVDPTIFAMFPEIPAIYEINLDTGYVRGKPIVKIGSAKMIAPLNIDAPKKTTV